MKVEKKYLLATAGVVWFIAGINILRIGLEAFHTQAEFILPIGAAIVVFLLFHILIFLKMVRKHVRRIKEYLEPKYHILRFFDKKAYIMMFSMITLGISLRMSGLCPDGFIAAFYSGLGTALVAAGIDFEIYFCKMKKEEML